MGILDTSLNVMPRENKVFTAAKVACCRDMACRYEFQTEVISPITSKRYDKLIDLLPLGDALVAAGVDSETLQASFLEAGVLVFSIDFGEELDGFPFCGRDLPTNAGVISIFVTRLCCDLFLEVWTGWYCRMELLCSTGHTA